MFLNCSLLKTEVVNFLRRLCCSKDWRKDFVEDVLRSKDVEQDDCWYMSTFLGACFFLEWDLL